MLSTSNINNIGNINIDINANTNEKEIQFKNKYINKLKYNLKYSNNFKKEKDLAFKESRTK